ncbi:MAG: VOC family protein [Fischerella sp.]|nr:VOC family protein [Fischerella sp.]
MKDFQIQGVNHIALVCKDMARTVDFYTNVLRLNLIKTIALPKLFSLPIFRQIWFSNVLMHSSPWHLFRWKN